MIPYIPSTVQQDLILIPPIATIYNDRKLTYNDDEEVDQLEEESSPLHRHKRFSGSTLHVTAIYTNLPSDAPAWIHNAFEFLTRGVIDKGFRELVDTFILIERTYGFKSGMEGFTRINRPTIVTKWINNGRWRRKRMYSAMSAAELSVFEKDWWKWWGNIQPSWRKPGDKTEIKTDTNVDDWRTVVKPGINGWVSVLASLRWWRSSAFGHPEISISQNAYNSASKDVALVMHCLLKCLQ